MAILLLWSIGSGLNHENENYDNQQKIGICYHRRVALKIKIIVMVIDHSHDDNYIHENPGTVRSYQLRGGLIIKIIVSSFMIKITYTIIIISREG